MEHSENVEYHQNKPRPYTADDAQDADIAELREKVDRLAEKLQTHNERHYLLMGIIATVSFLAGMGIKILDLFK